MDKTNPYDSLPERLHNCPNCGGTLQDDGKCRFCGSVVYDFVGIDLDKHKPVFIRMRHNGRIVHFKMIITGADFKMWNDGPVLYADNNPTMYISVPRWEGSVDFDIVGDIIIEDPEITGVGG